MDHHADAAAAAALHPDILETIRAAIPRYRQMAQEQFERVWLLNDMRRRSAARKERAEKIKQEEGREVQHHLSHPDARLERERERKRRYHRNKIEREQGRTPRRNNSLKHMTPEQRAAYERAQAARRKAMSRAKQKARSAYASNPLHGRF